MTDIGPIRKIIAEECPGLARDCIDGTAGADRYRAAAANFVAERYPRCELAFAYGSAARGEPGSCSDLDLYVIAEGEPRTLLLEIHEGLPIEARVLDPAGVDALFRQPADCRRSVFLARALEDARWVAGSEALLRTLRQRALEWLEECPRETGIGLITEHRVRVTNRVLDLARARPCNFRRLKAVFEIADSIRVLSNAEKSLFQGRNMIEHLAARWPARAERLVGAIERVLNGNDAAPLVALAIEALEPFGGLLLDRVRSRSVIEA